MLAPANEITQCDPEPTARELAAWARARPRTRADCENASRPCPWISCRHHLFGDTVNARYRQAFKEIGAEQLEQLPETCSLDVADRGGATLEEVGAIMGLTRERVRQIEEQVRMKLKKQTRSTLGTFQDYHEPDGVDRKLLRAAAEKMAERIAIAKKLEEEE